MKISVINGPNLNRLGARDPKIYGSRTLADIESMLSTEYDSVEFIFYQSNSEGDIIDKIQETYQNPEIIGIIINPGAYSHYSYAIADAFADSDKPIVEVHISNIFAREDFRRNSVTGPYATAVISGAGVKGYLLAAKYLVDLHHSIS